jgi:16S rRNA A1518/A1519 N6-dimethyltransferase RsmA/KsgA/DIM1 with predicted DNA glycosylase/AP lyase activity
MRRRDGDQDDLLERLQQPDPVNHPSAEDVEALLRVANIPPTARAEEIELERFCALARAVAERDA